jgi:hypothetical protein
MLMVDVHKIEIVTLDPFGYITRTFWRVPEENELGSRLKY